MNGECMDMYDASQKRILEAVLDDSGRRGWQRLWVLVSTEGALISKDIKDYHSSRSCGMFYCSQAFDHFTTRQFRAIILQTSLASEIICIKNDPTAGLSSLTTHLVRQQFDSC